MNKIENGKKRKGFKQTTMNHPVLVSVFSVVICLMVLVSFSYAWFITVLQGSMIDIEAGTFGAKAVVSQTDITDGSVTPIIAETTGSQPVIVTVNNGGIYQVSLETTGTASKGFCIVTVTVKDTAGETLSQTVYRIATIATGGTFAFTLESTGGGTTEIAIAPSWGEYQETQSSAIQLIGNEEKITVAGDTEQ